MFDDIVAFDLSCLSKISCNKANMAQTLSNYYTCNSRATDDSQNKIIPLKLKFDLYLVGEGGGGANNSREHVL